MNVKNKYVYIMLRNYYHSIKETNSRMKAFFRIKKSHNCALEISQIKLGILRYLSTVKMNDYEFKFSASADKTTLFSSVYAVLIYGLLDTEFTNEERLSWESFFDHYQDEDGLWREKGNPFCLWIEQTKEWNDLHLLPHMIWAYTVIGKKPKKRFVFLDKFLERDYCKRFCESLDFTNIWGASNGIMNYLCALEYARDFMGESEFNIPIKYLMSFLKSKVHTDVDGVDECWRGLWFEGNMTQRENLYNAVRGAYHIWPIFLYEGEEIKYVHSVIDTILSLQNRWGGWDSSIISSACADIDCIDPLVRLSMLAPDYRKEDIFYALNLALRYQRCHYNKDGGFVFELGKAMNYGNQNMKSRAGESNMFATWFRLLSVLLILSYTENYPIKLLNVSGCEFYKGITKL